MKNAHTACALLCLAAFLAGCATTPAPPMECSFWSEPPITDYDAEVMSSPLARWLDAKTSTADRVCP